jgi:hypothetical protein
MVTLAVCAFAVAKRQQNEVVEIVERPTVSDGDTHSMMERRPW